MKRELGAGGRGGCGMDLLMKDERREEDVRENEGG